MLGQHRCESNHGNTFLLHSHLASTGRAPTAGQLFAKVSVRVDSAATSLSSTGASFNVDQQVGYLQSGRSIACR